MGATMYEAASQAIWEAYGPHLSGSRQGTFGVVSAQPLDTTAIRALENSARKLGFGENACVFCFLRAGIGRNATPDETDAPDEQLDSATLFRIIEGIDPLVLVAADSEAIRALSQAYRTEIAPLARSRALGRTVVSFRSFENMLGTAQEKQNAWALLKKLV